MDDKLPRLTLASLKILRVFLDNPTRLLAGIDVQRMSGVATGTLYPILLRFEAVGILDSKWEEINPREAGRPRKRFYWLTLRGSAVAADTLNDLGNMRAALA